MPGIGYVVRTQSESPLPADDWAMPITPFGERSGEGPSHSGEGCPSSPHPKSLTHYVRPAGCLRQYNSQSNMTRTCVKTDNRVEYDAPAR